MTQWGDTIEKQLGKKQYLSHRKAAAKAAGDAVELLHQRTAVGRVGTVLRASSRHTARRTASARCCRRRRLRPLCELLVILLPSYIRLLSRYAVSGDRLCTTPVVEVSASVALTYIAVAWGSLMRGARSNEG